MIKFALGAIAGAVTAIVGAWIWVVRRVQAKPTLAADPEKE